MIQNIFINLDIRPNEARPTFLLLLHSFFFGLTIVFIESTASALFLAKFDVSMIPYAYVVGAIVTTLIGFLYSRLEEELSPPALFQLTVLGLALSVVLFRVILLLTDATWPAFIIFMWIDVLGVFLALQFWGLCERIFDLRQGKRLFGFISSGEVLGGITGGMLIKYIVHITGTPNLLWLTALWMIVSLGVLRYIIEAFPEQVSEEEAEEEDDATPAGLGIFRERYFFLLMVVSVISIFSQYFIDYAFYDRAESCYSGEDQLAAFFGIFWAAVYVSSLVVRIFISGKVLTRLGVRGGLLATPVVMTFGILAAVAIGFVPQAIGLFFWIIMIIKLFDEVVRPSVDEPAILTLYQPLSPVIRHGVQAKVEGVIEPAASGIAGLVLILINLFFPLSAMHVIYIMFLVLALWLGAGVILGREYANVLKTAVAKRYITASSVSFEDGESLEILKKGLVSSRPAEALYSLNLLEEIQPDSLSSVLVELLDYPDAMVRRQALIAVERHNIIEATHKVREIIAEDRDTGVRSRALETLCAISEPDILEELFHFLHYPDSLIKKGAIVGFLKNGGIEGIMAGGEVLIDLVGSPDAGERRLAAEIVGEVGIRNFYRPLLALINDENDEVLKAAIIAAGKLNNTRLWPYVMKNLLNPKVRQTVAVVLASGGDAVLSLLEETLTGESVSREVVRQIFKILGNIRGKKTLNLLLKQFEKDDGTLRNLILPALSECGYRADRKEKTRIMELIMEELENAAWYMGSMYDLRKDSESVIVRSALEQELSQGTKRIFLLLSFIYPRSSILNAWSNLRSTDPEKRAYAIETVDTLFPGDVKNLLIPLIDDIGFKARLKKLGTVFSQEQLSADARILKILQEVKGRISSWTRACALYRAGKYRSAEFYDQILRLIKDSDPVVRETAVWALHALKPDKARDFLKEAIHDESSIVSAVARNLLETSP